VGPKSFYHRKKVRLPDFRAVRSELCVVYRACIAQDLPWEDARSAALILGRIAALDQSAGLDARLEALERGIAEIQGQPSRPVAKPNGGHHPRPGA
jgi:hypothetical protein